jgi:hypothetical protein
MALRRILYEYETKALLQKSGALQAVGTSWYELGELVLVAGRE